MLLAFHLQAALKEMAGGVGGAISKELITWTNKV
jgi:hypothetical protein